jgi:LmbE family N-acetylglucosaminyl deacetylase/CheY-like chemotaxis protein
MGEDRVMTQDGRGPGRDAQILFVEDDEVVATFVVELLGRLGDVRWLTSAEQAAELVGRRDWDLIISDIELPGANGLEFIARVDAAQPVVAKLILSGHSSFDHAVAALRAGADDYLTKPIEPGALLEKASALIALTRARRASGTEIVLAVGAHPDDVEIGVGGILLRHAAQGHAVTVLTLTSGEAGGAANERAQESRRAAELLSARLISTDLADTSVSEGGATIAAISAAIREIRPTTVYTHTAHDVHQDHRNTHRATLVAARAIGRVFCYEAPSSTAEFRPTRFVAIDEYLERKLEVIQAYTSQVKVRHYLDEELLRCTARYWGRFAQARYVEPLEVVRDSDAPPRVQDTGVGTPLEAPARSPVDAA